MPAQPAPPDAAPAGGRRAVITTWLQSSLLLAVLVGGVSQIVRHWSEVSQTLASLPLPSVVLSFLAALAGTLLGPFMWRIVLAELGTPIARADASRIYLVGQLGKYLPGSVWAFVFQMELGNAGGITRGRALTASLITTGLGMIASLITGLLAVPVILGGSQQLLWVFVPLPLGLVLLHPRLLTWIVSQVLRVLRREPLPRQLSAIAILKNLGLGMATWLLLGVHLWLLADSIGSRGLDTLLLCIGAMSLAMTAGALAFVLPSGIGAREVVLVAVLASTLPSGSALALAVVSRVMFTVVDLASAGGAALLARARTQHGIPDPAAG